MKLGILAGGKDLPLVVIAHCRATNRPYFVLAFEDQTDPETTKNSDHAWVRLGAIGQSIKILKQEGVQDILMVGPMKRPSWQDIRPDAKGALWFAKLAKHAFGDDSMLKIIIDQLENEGFKVIGVEELMGTTLLAPAGKLGKYEPDEQAKKDIQHGLKALHLLGQADIGQSVIVQAGFILGVEAAEGTNELIRRCERLHRPGLGGVLVKTTKPNQDRRVDLPTIGLETVKLASRHGLRGIALREGSVQIMQRDETIQIADQTGIFIFGATDDPA
jgi:DUF1009 family protein